MNKKSNRIETINAILDDSTVNEPYPQFIIEPEIIEYAEYVTEKVMERTFNKEGWTPRKMGVLGQELFNGFLLQYKIPNVYANPIYEDMVMRKIKEKHFDFIIPHMPDGMQIVSVKVTQEGIRYKRFLANVEQWKNEIHDIAIGIKINSLQNRKAHIAGWLYPKEVEKLPIIDLGTGDAYYTYLDPTEATKEGITPLRNTIDLMQTLLKGSLKF
jgi:hypothetical protein